MISQYKFNVAASFKHLSMFNLFVYLEILKMCEKSPLLNKDKPNIYILYNLEVSTGIAEKGRKLGMSRYNNKWQYFAIFNTP